MTINVIIGPPCAGKSTHVKQSALEGDVVVDYDVLAQAFGAQVSHKSEGSVRKVALTARQSAIDRILEGVSADSWVIHTRPSAGLLDKYVEAGAVLTLLDPGLDECLERAQNDERPSGTDEAIKNWYDDPPSIPAKENKGKNMLTKKRLDVPLKIKSVSETGEFEGYGSVFGVKDSYSDIVVRGAFEKSLTAWKEKGQMPALLWQHKMDEPIGIYTEIKEDENGLYVKGRLLINDDPLAKRAHAHMTAGSLSGLSIGYMLNDYDYDSEKDAFILKEIELWEVSLVTFPANDEARISNVKNAFAAGNTPRPSEMERTLRDVGLSRSQAKSFMADGYSALNLRDADTEQALESLKSLSNVFAGE